MENIKKILRSNLIKIFILFIFSFDLLTKIIIVYDFEGFRRYSAIPKAILEIGLFYFIIKDKKFNNKIMLCALFLLLITLLNTLILVNDISIEILIVKGYTLNKYLFLFLFSSVFLMIKDNKKILYQIRNVLLVVGFVNSLFIIIGLFSEIELLRAYPNSQRFGYNGLFLKTSEASYFYILLIITTYQGYANNYLNKITFYIFLLSSLLIGTKVVWVFILLLIGVHFLLHRKKEIRNTFIAISISGLLIVVFLRDSLVKLVVNMFSFGPSIYEEYGFLTVITSTRDLLFINAYKYVTEEWTIINYLFGGANLREIGVEFEFVDIFLYFGIFGLAIFLVGVKSIFLQKENTKIGLFLFYSFMIVVFFAGNFFMSIICSIFAFVVFHQDLVSKKDI